MYTHPLLEQTGDPHLATCKEPGRPNSQARGSSLHASVCNFIVDRGVRITSVFRLYPADDISLLLIQERVSPRFVCNVDWEYDFGPSEEHSLFAV